MGWNPGDNREFFTMDELIEAFSLEGLSKSPAIFDMEKLTWMNGEYIKNMTPEQFKHTAMPWIEKSGFPIERFDADVICQLLQTRALRLDHMMEQFDFLVHLPDFSPELYTHKKMKTNPEIAKTALAAALEPLRALPEWSAGSIHDCLLGVVAALGMKNGQVLWPVRIAISGLPARPAARRRSRCCWGRRKPAPGLKRRWRRCRRNTDKERFMHDQQRQKPGAVL